MSSLADQVALELTECIVSKGCASLAVPGGSTPGQFFEFLSQKPIKWLRVKVLPTDERFVQETSGRSNAKLIRRMLLNGPAADAEFHSLYREAASPEAAIDLIRDDIDSLLPLDVCVLGMGEDMHTASLFPGADGLEIAMDEGAPSIIAMRSELIPEPRLTLTAPVLMAAKQIHILIVGSQKKQALATAMEAGSLMIAPVRCVLQEECPTTIHFAD